ncbi:MAG: FAD-binding protein [Proteobacteria bacterium]|nr:FAD-binding protein [Pseudomonadota bacterium]
MKALVLAEYDQGGLKKTTLSTLSAALQVAEKVTVLLVGSHSKKISEVVTHLVGVEKVIVNTAAIYNFGKAESISPLIAELSKSFNFIFASASSEGKNIMPRVAALLDVAQISEITAIIAQDTFKRPIYAGNAIATVQSKDPIKVITVRHTAFPLAEFNEELTAPIEENQLIYDHPRAHFIEQNLNVSDRPELASAQVVVSGGRAFGSREQFKNLLEPLAVKLNAAIGASRAAVDAGYVDNDYQVGQTGKVVAPTLYIAIGISGAIQHLAGMKDSKIIVAINKDPNAEIMKIADYTLQADLFHAVPELINKL